MDFLDRLVERQRSPRLGVRPELPSRYEPVSEALREVEDLAIATRDPSEPAQDPSRSVISQRAVESPVVRAPQPDPVLPPRPAAETPRPRPLPPVRDPGVRVMGDRERRPDAESPPIERARAPVARREPRAAPPLVEVRPTVTDEAPGPAPSQAALPTPMLPAPAPAPAQPAPGEATHRSEGPEPRPSRSTTVSISIGRIEIRPPDPARTETRPRPDAPVAPPRPAYRPRLSLEGYLERPNRGRS
ncbi:hypothetical protein [Nocardioides sp. cx-173]|uniref:hypothetical protein n=1 Tax=Nocardioides sp. cx-173 TaxID=2898796 RepID=UPI001E3B2553|nr:hypothetical protein [Nocardioides sp. cx-173]MCD4525962.1 hypothetical protein [Nocardioides sp. cx-173]UGB43659.1 hypothetical protein LQ940_09070 [Nocardioides sp. cx-173]